MFENNWQEAAINKKKCKYYTIDNVIFINDL